MLNSYISYMKAEKMAENTQRAYNQHINQMLDYIGKNETEITYLDLIDWKASIADMSSATVANKIAAIHSYFQFMLNAGLIADDPSKNIKRPNQVKNKEKPYISEEDAKLLVEYARTERDKAMFRFLLSTGCRFIEMANVTIEQYKNAINGDRVISLTVTKGNKGGNIYINESTQTAIDKYLRTRQDDCPYLFASFRDNQLSDNSVSHTIKTTARRAGLPYWNELSCHCLRAACATIMSDKGVPVATISKVLRHGSLSVTTRYIKTSQNNVNNATALMIF